MSYRVVCVDVTAALRHEELRCHYLSRELHILIALRDRWLADIAAARRQGTAPPSHTELYKRIVSESQLARELREM